MNFFFKILSVLAILLTLSKNLTGQQIKQACHCDITSDFCDFDCCCDLDCSSTIQQTCFYQLSSTFCIQTDYYYRVSPQLTSTTDQNCYYFNSTTQIEQQQNISSSQVLDIISKYKQDFPLSNDSQDMYQGYTSGDSIGISTAFIDSNGNCLSSTSSSITQTISFKQNIDISCLATTNNINMFKNVFGQSINKYYLDSKTTISITQPSQTYTEATIFFILGTFGSQKSYYIQDIRVLSNNNEGALTRRLKIRFVNPTEIQKQQGQPSFFPQIPYDIFFPIQQYFFTSPL